MKRIALLVGIVIALSLFCSCAKKDQPSTLEIITELTLREVGLPAGSIYSTISGEGDDGHMSPSLIATLYGDGSTPKVSEGWIECSAFIPLSNHPCEFSVIYCSSYDVAENTAALLSRRLLLLQKAKCGGEYDFELDSAKVIIFKNYAILIISSDSAAAEKLVKTMLG